MGAQAGEAEIAGVCRKIEAMGFRAHVLPGAQRTAVGITSGLVDLERFELSTSSMPFKKYQSLAGGNTRNTRLRL